MTDISATETASLGRNKRWLTPLLITAYIVAILLISGLTRAKDEQAVAGSIGESTTAPASLEDAVQGSVEIHR